MKVTSKARAVYPSTKSEKADTRKILKCRKVLFRGYELARKSGFLKDEVASYVEEAIQHIDEVSLVDASGEEPLF